MSRLRERAAGKEGKTIGTCRRSLSANGPGDGTFLAFPSAAAFSGAVCRGAALAMGASAPGRVRRAARSTRRFSTSATVPDRVAAHCRTARSRECGLSVRPKTWGDTPLRGFAAAARCRLAGVWQRPRARLPYLSRAPRPFQEIQATNNVTEKTRFSIQIGQGITAGAWLERLGDTILAIFPVPAERKAAYRLLSSGKVSMEHILEPHQATMVERCRVEDVVLAIQDPPP